MDSSRECFDVVKSAVMDVFAKELHDDAVLEPFFADSPVQRAMRDLCGALTRSVGVAQAAQRDQVRDGVYRQIVQPRALLGRARRRLPKACGPLLVRVQETWSRPTL